MFVVAAVLVVISKNSAIISLESPVINVCKIIASYSPSFINPNLTAYLSVSLLFGEEISFITDLPFSHDLL